MCLCITTTQLLTVVCTVFPIIVIVKLPGFIKSTYFSIIKLCGMLFHFHAQKVYTVKPLFIASKGTGGEKKSATVGKLKLQESIKSVRNTSKQQNENYRSSASACMRWCSSLRHCATRQKVAGLIVDEVTVIYH